MYSFSLRRLISRKTKFLLLLVLAIIVSFIVILYLKWPKEVKFEIVKYFPFSKENSLREWKEKIFKGRVLYKIDTKEHESFVLATSKGTASALYYKIRLDMDKRPLISWKWNAKEFPAKDGLEDLRNAKQDDFAARVYVIFPALFFTKSKALEYIWVEKIKEETVSPSPYSKNLKLIVIETGKKENEEWVYEERDIYNDYKKAFGEKPRYDIGAIAFMTDADSTGSTAEAFYDEIKIGYKKDIGEKER